MKSPQLSYRTSRCVHTRPDTRRGVSSHQLLESDTPSCYGLLKRHNNTPEFWFCYRNLFRDTQSHFPWEWFGAETPVRNATARSSFRCLSITDSMTPRTHVHVLSIDVSEPIQNAVQYLVPFLFITNTSENNDLQFLHRINVLLLLQFIPSQRSLLHSLIQQRSGNSRNLEVWDTTAVNCVLDALHFKSLRKCNLPIVVEAHHIQRRKLVVNTVVQTHITQTTP